VKTFDTLHEASIWLSSERERAAVEKPAEKVLGNRLPDRVAEIVAELQRASNGAKTKLHRGTVLELAYHTYNLSMER
jgi:hypothetical protein